MLKSRNLLHPVLIAGCVFVSCLGIGGVARAASLQLSIQEDRVDLHADRVSLISVLKAIAREADIRLECHVPLTRPVSLDLKGVSIEDSVRRLLFKHNHTLIFARTGDADFSLTKISVIPSGTKGESKPQAAPQATVRPAAVQKEIAPPTVSTHTPHEALGESFRRYEKDQFRQEFENMDRLLDEIAMVPADDLAIPDPSGSVAKIDSIASSSILEQIGLKGGDVIRDVNGQQVNGKKEFLWALQRASEDQSMIRIERTNENGMMDPIYIELSSADSPSSTTPPPISKP